MKKKILTLLLLASQTLAFAGGSALLVTLKDGTKAGYLLSEKPVVTFGESNINIKNGTVDVSYERTHVSTCTFVDESELTVINTLKQGNTTFEYRDGKIQANGEYIQVFSLNGHLMMKGRSSLSLETLPTGVYIVKMGQQAVKVKK